MERRERSTHTEVELAPDGHAVGGGTGAGVDYGPLGDLTGFLLRLAQLRVFETVFAGLTSRGVGPGQVAILATVGRNPGIRQGVLATALSIKRSNMAKTVGVLTARGLVVRRVPPNDRRAVELRLTPNGRDLVDKVLPRLKLGERAATAMLTAGERATLHRVLRKIAEAPHRGES